MNDRARGVFSAVALALAVSGGVSGACAADRAPGSTPTPLPPLPALLETDVFAVETVVFPNKGLSPVRVVRGPSAPPRPIRPTAVATPTPVKAAPPSIPSPPIPSLRREIVSFGSGFADQVIVVRGSTPMPANLARPIPAVAQAGVEKVAFADSRQAPVNVIRGNVMRGDAAGDMFFSIAPAFTGLFNPAQGGELDRVAFAVDGVESRHGADLRMWRPEPAGPQGPMQVSAAAALDVGGGDRFDIHQNRVLGRAYLAQMFQRYGNWPDAIAAYNWGPGNMDQWIAGGRNTERLPLGVVRYTNRVLRDALLAERTSL